MTKAYRGRGPRRAGGDGLGSILGYGVGGTLLRDEDTAISRDFLDSDCKQTGSPKWRQCSTASCQGWYSKSRKLEQTSKGLRKVLDQRAYWGPLMYSNGFSGWGSSSQLRRSMFRRPARPLICMYSPARAALEVHS